MWTRFMDMHSGGSCKLPPYDKILIEAPEDEARTIFYNRFGRNPERVTCTCCGEDYSISESPTLAEATAYDRRCQYVTPTWALKWRQLTAEQRRDANAQSRYIEPDESIPHGFSVSEWSARSETPETLESYLKREDVLVIRADEIRSEERSGSVPEQGYVWRG